ncbi:MAG: hypothetical protein J6M39_06815 [Lachnospiraceae bacterium]|nr:hypothetical protein [Lachnospiraceae bacterium]
MADFNKAITKVLKKEGGYANNPADRGGETYKGIARRYHGKNYMWVLIDRLKDECGGVNNKFKAKLNLNEQIDAEVKKIYKTDYWDKFKLDTIPNQKVAEQVFDDAVNRGVGAACKLCCALLELPVSTAPTKKLISLLQTL